MTVYVTVDNNTRVMVTGYNAQGQCGQGNISQLNAFTYMPMYWPTGIRSIYATMTSTMGGFVLIMDNNNRLYGCGQNYARRFVPTFGATSIIRDVTAILM